MTLLSRFGLALTCATVFALSGTLTRAAAPEYKTADSRELPSYIIPNIPVAAEAY